MELLKVVKVRLHGARTELLFFQWSPMVGYVMSPEIPLVLNFLLADFTLQLPPYRVHVQYVLLQVELIAEHPLAVLAHPGLPALPGGPQ